VDICKYPQKLIFQAYIGQRSRAAKITSADAGAICNGHQEKDALHRNGVTDAQRNRAENTHRKGATDTHLNGATNTHRNGYRSHANGGSK
jgi:hypothetical protein